jgi:hypothetical protein
VALFDQFGFQRSGVVVARSQSELIVKEAPRAPEIRSDLRD